MKSIYPTDPKENDRLDIKDLSFIYLNNQWILESLIPLHEGGGDENNSGSGGNEDTTPLPPTPNINFNLTNADYWLPQPPPSESMITDMEKGDYHIVTIPDGDMGIEQCVIANNSVFKIGDNSPPLKVHGDISYVGQIVVRRLYPKHILVILTSTMLFVKPSGGNWVMTNVTANAKSVLLDDAGNVIVVYPDKIERVMDIEVTDGGSGGSGFTFNIPEPRNIAGNIDLVRKFIVYHGYGIFITNDGEFISLQISSETNTFTANVINDINIDDPSDVKDIYFIDVTVFLKTSDSVYAVNGPDGTTVKLGEFHNVSLIGVLYCYNVTLDVDGKPLEIAASVLYFSSGDMYVYPGSGNKVVKYQYPLNTDEKIINVGYGHVPYYSGSENTHSHLVAIESNSGVRIENLPCDFIDDAFILPSPPQEY